MTSLTHITGRARSWAIIFSLAGFLLMTPDARAAEEMKVKPQISHEEGTSAPTYDPTEDPTTSAGEMKVYPQEKFEEGSQTTGYPVDAFDRERVKTLEEMRTEEESTERIIPPPFEEDIKVHPQEKGEADPTYPVERY